MNRVFFCASLSIIILSCQSNRQKSGNNQNSGPQTLESFADSMVRLNKFSAESIDVAADYYKRLVPADSALADSAAVMFLRHVNTVVDSTNQQLFNDTTDYFELVYNQSKNVPGSGVFAVCWFCSSTSFLSSSLFIVKLFCRECAK